MAIQPRFARPLSCVTTFSSQEKFIEWLLEHKVPYWGWGEKVHSKAWKEIDEGDAVYYVAPISGKPTRFVCVISTRIIMRHPKYGPLVLVEYVRDDNDPDWYKPRRQTDSSLSEKILLNRVTGEVVEKPIDTIIRCIKQETGMDVPIDELKRKGTVKFMPWHHSSGFIDGGSKVEIDARKSENNDKTEKREGVENYRQIAHYTVTLSTKHYRTGYQDPQTRYFAQWHSWNKSIKSIPAEEVMRIMSTNRAAA